MTSENKTTETPESLFGDQSLDRSSSIASPCHNESSTSDSEDISHGCSGGVRARLFRERSKSPNSPESRLSSASEDEDEDERHDEQHCQDYCDNESAGATEFERDNLLSFGGDSALHTPANTREGQHHSHSHNQSPAQEAGDCKQPAVAARANKIRPISLHPSEAELQDPAYDPSQYICEEGRAALLRRLPAIYMFAAEVFPQCVRPGQKLVCWVLAPCEGQAMIACPACRLEQDCCLLDISGAGSSVDLTALAHHAQMHQDIAEEHAAVQEEEEEEECEEWYDRPLCTAMHATPSYPRSALKSGKKCKGENTTRFGTATVARVRRLPVPAVPSELESLRKHQKTRELAFAKHLHTSYAGLLDFHYWYCTLDPNNSITPPAYICPPPPPSAAPAPMRRTRAAEARLKASSAQEQEEAAAEELERARAAAQAKHMETFVNEEVSARLFGRSFFQVRALHKVYEALDPTAKEVRALYHRSLCLSVAAKVESMSNKTVAYRYLATYYSVVTGDCESIVTPARYKGILKTFTADPRSVDNWSEDTVALMEAAVKMQHLNTVAPTKEEADELLFVTENLKRKAQEKVRGIAATDQDDAVAAGAGKTLDVEAEIRAQDLARALAAAKRVKELVGELCAPGSCLSTQAAGAVSTVTASSSPSASPDPDSSGGLTKSQRKARNQRRRRASEEQLLDEVSQRLSARQVCGWCSASGLRIAINKLLHRRDAVLFSEMRKVEFAAVELRAMARQRLGPSAAESSAAEATGGSPAEV